MIHDYYRTASISKDIIGSTPDTAVAIYGEPDELIVEDLGLSVEKVYYRFDDFSVDYLLRDGEYTYSGFSLYSSERKLRHNIYVGCCREDIISLFEWLSCPKYSQVLGDCYLDSGPYNAYANAISFEYDEDGVVEKITVTDNRNE